MDTDRNKQSQGMVGAVAVGIGVSWRMSLVKGVMSKLMDLFRR